MKNQNLFFNGKMCLSVLGVTSVVVLLVACPAAGGGRNPGSYLCTNGTPVEGSADSAGQSRCLRCNLFYSLNGPSGALGTSCQEVTALGAALRIGSANQFGVSENFPTDLAAIDDTLYMVGADTDKLHIINIDDGTATPVGPLPRRFGVGEDNPRGLAAVGATLYMVGSTNDVLYTINIADDMTADGQAIQVGQVDPGFDVGETIPTGLAAIGDTLYMVGMRHGRLFTLNIDADNTADNGKATPVSSLESGFGVGESNPTGLASLGNQLYVVGRETDRLYTLNILTGTATQVGLVDQYEVSEERASGLAAMGNILYMVGASTDALYALRYR